MVSFKKPPIYLLFHAKPRLSFRDGREWVLLRVQLWAKKTRGRQDGTKKRRVGLALGPRKGLELDG